MFRADFLRFTLKIVEHSRHLPRIYPLLSIKIVVLSLILVLARHREANCPEQPPVLLGSKGA